MGTYHYQGGAKLVICPPIHDSPRFKAQRLAVGRKSLNNGLKRLFKSSQSLGYGGEVITASIDKVGRICDIRRASA